MKTCPVCALDLDDAYLFCPEDGSSLGTGRRETTARDAVANSDYLSDTDRADHPVVLYCPTCAAEYPLTFSACPVHRAPLVKHAIPRRPVLSTSQAAGGSSQRPSIERVERTVQTSASKNDQVSTQSGHVSAAAPEAISNEKGPAIESPLFAHQMADGQRFRLAAIATTTALVILALVALYTFVSNMSRRRLPSNIQVASKVQDVSLPFIATPKEAQDYVEEPPAPEAPSAPSHKAEKESTERRVAQPADRMRAAAGKPPASILPASARNSTTSDARLLAPPRDDSGGFDARLVRVRGLRTASGYHYDLTFNIQERAGRSAQWQRMLITTRTSSGVSRSQAIPFVHRLGATGALTFTIGVELTGRSEADWRGRVVCTTLGWDNRDRPLQASFGATLTP